MGMTPVNFLSNRVKNCKTRSRKRKTVVKSFLNMDKILLIDDDDELCELVAEYLTVENFAVEAVHDGASGLEKARTGDFDLITLDVMMPEMDGFEVLKNLRQTSKVPVLMLTARGDDTERIVGLDAGADDYLSKPFNPRELVARIRAILRRVQIAGESEKSLTEKFKVDDVEISISARSAKIGGEEFGCPEKTRCGNSRRFSRF